MFILSPWQPRAVRTREPSFPCSLRTAFSHVVTDGGGFEVCGEWVAEGGGATASVLTCTPSQELHLYQQPMSASQAGAQPPRFRFVSRAGAVVTGPQLAALPIPGLGSKKSR